MGFELKDYAFIKGADGKFIVGHGPFEEYAECPGVGVVFYVNDFALSDPLPWKVPTRVERYDAYPTALAGGGAVPECQWEEIAPDGFAAVFREINEAIQQGVIEKSVPVVTQVGSTASALDDLIFKVPPGHQNYHSYAWVSGNKGFCGHTPEVLFSHEKGRLHTMALAGTARPEDRDVFAVDDKEIREHEFVAQTLVSKLSEIGMVQREMRQIMDLGSIVHFHSPIYVGLYSGTPLDLLIRKLHPTPALGPLPRTDQTMRQLLSWRGELACPSYFGSPFGVYDNGRFHSVVTIRGVHWDGQSVYLPSGCGVIEASRLTNEWRELQLKRAAVRSLFWKG